MTPPDIDRRRFLARSLVAGGALAAPAILTMEPASAAALQSPPPQRSGGEDQAPFKCGVCGEEVYDVNDLRAHTHRREDPAVALPGGLPKTGANIERETIAGAGLFAAGTSMWLWSAEDG